MDVTYVVVSLTVGLFAGVVVPRLAPGERHLPSVATVLLGIGVALLVAAAVAWLRDLGPLHWQTLAVQLLCTVVAVLGAHLVHHALRRDERTRP